VVEFVEILVEGLDCGDIVALARRLRTRSLGVFDGRPALFQVFCAGRFPELMVVRHRHAPLRHTAGRVLPGDAGKGFGGLLVPEGVQQSHRAIELRLERGVAGNRELDLAEFFRLTGAVFVLGQGGYRQYQWHENSQRKHSAGLPHTSSCFI